MSACSSDPRVNASAALAGLQGDTKPTTRAEGLASVDEQNRLLAGIETRLANEMRGLGLTLREFAFRTKAIREEIPADAQFCKLVTGFFPLLAFQLSNSLLSDTKRFTFEDDGALYLHELGLEVEDFARQVDLEGRKFLAVALIDKSGCDFLDGATNRDNRGQVAQGAGDVFEHGCPSDGTVRVEEHAFSVGVGGPPFIPAKAEA